MHLVQSQARRYWYGNSMTFYDRHMTVDEVVRLRYDCRSLTGMIVSIWNSFQ